MKKSTWLVSMLLLVTLAAAAQSVSLYHVPKYNNRTDARPAIAANSDGDIMLAYVNTGAGMMYYYKHHESSSWTGPTPIPRLSSDLILLESTDLIAGENGDFHMMACATNWGLFYARFDSKTQQWTEQGPIYRTGGRLESAYMTENPITKEIVTVFMEVVFNPQPNKDLFFTVKTAPNTWSGVFNVVGGPYGDALPMITCDEQGRVVLAYKTDFIKGSTEDLGAAIDLKDPKQDYKTLSRQAVTWDLWGWQFCPTVAMLRGGQGMIVYFWYDKSAYYYVPFKVTDTDIVIDYTKLSDWILDAGPTVPHFTFYNRLMAYGDECICSYVTPSHEILMMRYKNGEWSRNNKVNLTAGERTYSDVFFGACAEPNVGILTAWESDPDVYFSIYDYKKTIIRPPVNAQLQHSSEKGMFRQYYINVLTWENNPLNAAKNITVTKYNIYRKLKTGKQDFVKIGEVSSSASKLTYVDKQGVGAVNKFKYAISAADNNGNESYFTEVQ